MQNAISRQLLHTYNINDLTSWDVVRVCCLGTTVASAALALGRNVVHIRGLGATVASAVLTFDQDVGIHSFSSTSQWLRGHGHRQSQ